MYIHICNDMWLFNRTGNKYINSGATGIKLYGEVYCGMFRYLKPDKKINCLTTALIHVGIRAEVTYHPLFCVTRQKEHHKNCIKKEKMLPYLQ